MFVVLRGEEEGGSKEEKVPTINKCERSSPNSG